MFSAKTSSLLSAIDRLQYQSRKVIAFKPKIDSRYSTENITTHTGQQYPAVCISTGDELLAHIAVCNEKFDVIAVDEAFMIDGISEALIMLFREGVTVIVSSLDMSAGCVPFKEIQEILPWATKVEKLTAVCSLCKADAHYTQRKFDDSSEEIRVGGEDLYEPRCFRCHTGIGYSWDSVEKNWKGDN